VGVAHPTDYFHVSFARSARRQAVLEVEENMGFAALTDEALVELAVRHWKYRQKVLGD